MINGNPKYEWSCTVSRYLFWRKANRMRYKQFLTSGRLEMEFFSYSRFDHCIQHTFRLIKRTLKLLYTKREVEKSHHSSSWKISNDVDERSHLQHLWWRRGCSNETWYLSSDCIELWIKWLKFQPLSDHCTVMFPWANLFILTVTLITQE